MFKTKIYCDDAVSPFPTLHQKFLYRLALASPPQLGSGVGASPLLPDSAVEASPPQLDSGVVIPFLFRGPC